MKSLRSAVALLAMAPLLCLAASPARADRLATPALPGFVVGFEASNAGQSIREEVPAGETVKNWTRMVTTQRFVGAAARFTPGDLLAVMARNLAAACPGARTSDAITATTDGHPSARYRADCPLLAQTGKPETFIILVISDGEDLHAKQVAFRREPTAADLRWAEGVLGAVKLCGSDEEVAGCRN